ncbi:MAG TPA: HEPN domain-containing protein [Candidatus Nanoarchaeia archaeon]|nr:HEPN domain-containing protein [Candidatus Nanoarchaeia archaeon]
MKNSNFLNELKEKRNLELIEISEEISKSYLIKSEKCKAAAKAVFDAGIYENAISEAYYSIYNVVTALFYKCGIKCENHSAAVILLKILFNQDKLHEIFLAFKKDRIDNQYYMPFSNSEPISKEQCSEKLKIAQNFCIELKTYMKSLTNEDITNIRNNFNNI